MGKPSPKYRKYCSRHTIRSRTGGRHLRKTEYEDWRQKKYPAVRQRSKNKTLLEFMETKTNEGQYIVPEDIARDLKNELGVDYSLSGCVTQCIASTTHARLWNQAFKHAVRR